MSNRIKQAANANREAALLHRISGNDTTADRLEARANDLDSGKVTDRTDDAIALVQAAFRR
jgi:hypothetical protein